jgi:hypothetical protein
LVIQVWSFLHVKVILGPPRGPQEVEGPTNKIFLNIGKSTLFAFGHIYGLKMGLKHSKLSFPIHDIQEKC